jgi:hypothetical protein
MMRAAWVVVAGALVAAQLPAQSLAERVNAVRDGTVLMRFAARPGVCGDGQGRTWTRATTSNRMDRNDGWTCDPGPVRVAIGRADGQVVSVRTVVGGHWSPSRSETDLGDVAPSEAAHYLLSVARAGSGRSANEAISAAAFADAGNIAPELAALVKDSALPVESRKQALFWFGQSDASSDDLSRLYAGLSPFELREHFVFVLSQRHDSTALDKLIDVAQHDLDRELRKRAMFWLGQSREPRAVAFLRDILTR